LSWLWNEPSLLTTMLAGLRNVERSVLMDMYGQRV